MYSYVNEIGLLKKEDSRKYNALCLCRYLEDKDFVSSCKQMLKNALEDEKFLFSISVHFQLKKVKEDGSPEYRPIHSADIKTLVCLQVLANIVFYDDDLETGMRQINPICMLVPDNFWGNRLTDQVEYIYKNWVGQYKGYVQTTIDKHRHYASTKEFTYEAYLDIKDFFPNINVYSIYEKILNRIPGKFVDKREHGNDGKVFKDDKSCMARILQLLLCFKIDGDLNEKERLIYYGTKVLESDVYYAKGLPQGLPHCAFFANWVMMDVAEIVDKHLKGDKDYYVDDITVFCNEEQKELRETVKKINKELSSLANVRISPLESENTFFIDNQIPFILQLHDGDDKCCSFHIDNEEQSIGNLMILNRKTSGVMQQIKVVLGENTDKSSLSLIECLLDAIDEERKKIAGDSEQGLYKKRLESFYKFYENRKTQLIERLGTCRQTDIQENKDKVIELINNGQLRRYYRNYVKSKSNHWQKVLLAVENVDAEYAKISGIDLQKLYYISVCLQVPRRSINCVFLFS